MKNRAMIPNPRLKPLAALVGEWRTTGKHPLVPGKELHGHASFEWIEGGAYLRMTTHIEDSRFPDGVAIIGSDDDELFMLYFDERGVSRKYDFNFSGKGWSWKREGKELSQRFICTIRDGGKSMVGLGEMSEEGGPWKKDLDLTYRKLA